MVYHLLLVDQGSLAVVNLVKKLARNTSILCWEQHLKCKMNINSYVGLFNSDSIKNMPVKVFKCSVLLLPFI